MTYTDTSGRLFGSYINVYSLANEPEGLPEADVTYDSDDYSPPKIPAIEWYKAVAAQVVTTRSNHANLPGMKIAAPSINHFPAVFGQDKSDLPDFVTEYASWVNNDSTVDYADVHLHAKDVAEVGDDLDWLQGHSTYDAGIDKPFIVTEWSQARAFAGGNPAFVNQRLDAAFAATYGYSTTMKNKEYVDATFNNPVPISQWNDFIDTAYAATVLDHDYMQGALNVMNAKGVVIVDYGQYEQLGGVGHERFDMKQLYATDSVVRKEDGQPYENSDFVDEYRNLNLDGVTMLKDDFEDDAVSGGASGWTPTNGSWSVVSDGSHQYAQSDTSGVTYSLVGNSPWDDYLIEADVTPETLVSGSLGLMARFTDNDNRYYALYNANTNKLAIQKRVGGTQTYLVSTDFTMGTGTMYHMKFETIGSSLRLFVDGQRMLLSKTAACRQARQASTFQTSAEFDNVQVASPDVYETFESGSAPNWTTHGGGTWAVADSGKTDKYEQQSSTVGAYTTSVYGSPDWTDYVVEADVQSPDTEAQGARIGIMSRYQDNDNWYDVEYSANLNKLFIQKNVSGTLMALASTSFDMIPDKTYTFRLEANGTSLKLFVDDALAVSATDRTFSKGKAGLIAKKASVQFDDVVIH